VNDSERCYKCGEPFACGWWCNNCRWTRNQAAWVQFAEGQKNARESWMMVTLAFVIGVAGMGLIAAALAAAR
jgi:hypothetical protein